MTTEIRRTGLGTFLQRLREPRRFLQVVAGPRQVGKTTLVSLLLQFYRPQQGQILVDGRVVGAIGVSGASSAQDDEVARAAIAAVLGG